MTLSKEATESLADAVRHALDTKGFASVALKTPGTEAPFAVVFVIPGRVGALVDAFLSDLYRIAGWHVEKDAGTEVH